MAGQATIHVVDDDAAVRDSLSFLLASEDFACRTYQSAAALLEHATELEPGCILTDVRMPEMNGLELLQEVKRRGLPHPVIVLTGHADIALAVNAMKSGAVDFLEKPFDDRALIATVRSALTNYRDRRGSNAEKADIENRIKELTPRELEVFEAIAAGDTNKEAALKLGISPRTVEIYRANVMSKLKANSLSELVRIALQRDNH